MPDNTKDILLFFSFKKHKTGYYRTLFDPLKAQQAHYGLKLHQGSLKDVHIEIVDNSLRVREAMTGRMLDEFDAVMFELWLKSPQQALAAATFLKRKGILFRGREALHTLCTTKIGELVRMSDHGLPLPRTFMSSHDQIRRVFHDSPPIDFPLIAKAADTFGGKMNYLVHDYESLRQVLSSHKDQFFVIQEFIPNDADYRVLIMGGKVRLVMKRSRTDKASHLNNTSAGANGEFVPIETLSRAMLQDAMRASVLTYRDEFAGVDLMIDNRSGQHYILEVNEAPAIQTGHNPEKKTSQYLEYIAELAAQKGRA